MPIYAIYAKDTGDVAEYREAANPGEAIAKWEPGPPTHAAEEVPDSFPGEHPASRTRRTGGNSYIDTGATDTEQAVTAAKANYAAASTAQEKLEADAILVSVERGQLAKADVDLLIR